MRVQIAVFVKAKENIESWRPHFREALSLRQRRRSLHAALLFVVFVKKWKIGPLFFNSKQKEEHQRAQVGSN